MAATQYYQLPVTRTLPVTVPGKGQQRYGRNVPTYDQYSASPPERPESVSTNSGAGLYSSASSQYASSEYESTGATSVDLLDYMNDRLSQTYNPLPMDRNLADQAQMSGQLNAKTRELLALQALARARLAKTRANLADGMQAARETQRDLEWTQKKVHALNRRAAEKYPEQYRAAVARYAAGEH
ncbi:hypothetical protein AMS68_005284 [Peltaster fructicola]|uniref:Biogenesis of lysosome-related organelles complex 1 subunit KXD1 n=1 Tax=Peltaster fructicola TaxID=286661 RepID=A0A6H0XYB5_9PEZI|nr:hypothetical protein AMS68_005284 [Peltaster fructicola]